MIFTNYLSFFIPLSNNTLFQRLTFANSNFTNFKNYFYPNKKLKKKKKVNNLYRT